MCGKELPTESGSMVCNGCVRKSSSKTCPTCGASLEAFSEEVYQTSDGVNKSIVYHCYNCHQDWEQEISYIERCSVFRKKFWG